MNQDTREVELPDRWWASRPGQAGTVWYRMAFNAPEAERPLWSIFIRQVCDTADVYLNGQLVHDGGASLAPPPRNCYRSQLITVPRALLQPGENLLDIKVRGHALTTVSARQRSGGLSEVLVGDPETLAEIHADQNFWGVSLVGVVTSATSVVGALLLWFGWINRREPRLMYLGLLILAWNLLSARILALQMPFEHHTAEVLVNLGFAAVTALGILFMLSHAGIRWRLLEAALVLQSVAMPATVGLVGPDRVFMAANGWRLALEFEVIAAMGLYLNLLWHSRAPRFGSTALCLTGLVLLLLVDRAGQLPFAFPTQLNMVHYLMPIVLALIGVRRLQGFAWALQEMETSRNSLENRMNEAAEEMERNFAQMAELRVEQVTEKERKRIAGDLHDDLGAKLLTIVHTSESERISTLAREALEEMRLSVKGLTGKPLPLSDALADWRAETVLRLGQAGVEVDWLGPIEDLAQQLSARAFVQTTRILREAVSNVIKHSGASQCTVRCSLGEHEFMLVVQDNGRGIPMELDGKLDRGHGMASMKHRAKQMQGQCLVESGPGYGTVIRLTLPL